MVVSVFSDIADTPVHVLAWWCLLDCLRKLSLALAETVLNFAGLFTLVFFLGRSALAGACRRLSKRLRGSCGRGNNDAASAASAAAPPRHRLTTASSGADANAGTVGAVRFLSAGRRDAFAAMDPQVRTFEEMFMSPTGRVFTWIAETLPIVGTVTLMFEGGMMAARTVVMDEEISRFLQLPALKRDSNCSSSSTVSAGSRPTSPTVGSSNAAAAAAAAPPSRKQQVLILGAGFDSRAYRLQALRNRPDVAVIEVDQAAVQAVKLRRLRAGLGAAEFKRLTARVEYVSVNFAHEGALEKALLSSRLFDPALPTFVLWEGVTYYLPLAAVHATLATLNELRGRAEDWTLVFDFTDSGAFDSRLRVSQRLNWAALGMLNHPCQSALPQDVAALQEELARHKLFVEHVWRGSELIGKLFPEFPFARSMLGLHIAKCAWLNNCDDQHHNPSSAMSIKSPPHQQQQQLQQTH